MGLFRKLSDFFHSPVVLLTVYLEMETKLLCLQGCNNLQGVTTIKVIEHLELKVGQNMIKANETPKRRLC